MEWLQSLNHAINYMEEHLTDNITCEDVAQNIYISNFHFQRTFNLLTGLTVGEYIRNRRLSLAGQDLLKGGVKAIDVALKYCYETPESFSKAFSRFHGTTPNQAKKEAMKVVAKTRLFSDETSQVEIPRFWSEYYETDLANKVCGMMGICIQAKEDKMTWEYGIGCKEQFTKVIPEGFQVLEIPSYTWAIFTCVGPMPKSIQNMWKKIYSEWLPQSDYELISDYDIEYYTDGDNTQEDYVSEIWIPVKQKNN